MLTKQHKSRKRVGRGGKRGTYSGKGQKGQKARAGRRIRPALRDIIKKLPKKRGYRSFVPPQPVRAVNIGLLERLFAHGARVTKQTLREKGVKIHGPERIKILGSGSLSKKLTVEGLAASQSAVQKIIAAGGTIA